MREEEERSMLSIWGGTKVRASFVLNRVFSPNILVYTFFFFFLSNLQHFFFLPFSTSFLYEMYFTSLCQVPYELSLMREVQRAFKNPLVLYYLGTTNQSFLVFKSLLWTVLRGQSWESQNYGGGEQRDDK